MIYQTVSKFLAAAAAVSAVKLSLDGALLDSNQPFGDAFVSYSIEFSSFPDFAGNNSSPNTFSDNLLNNIGDIIGTKPYIRVGGNTQDYALYNASLPYALNGTYNLTRSADYPTTIFIGPSYFESYNTWPGVKFSHGFNLGLGGSTVEGWQTLLDTVPLACKAIGPDNLDVWEYGNEPDLFSTSAQGPVRPTTWNEAEYVSQWLNGTRQIKTLLEENCPDMVTDHLYAYMAPSFGGVGNKLKADVAWAAGLNVDADINMFSTHNYISGATSPGVTLQGTLLNHTRTMQSVDAHIVEYNKLNDTSVPLIMGETNSLYNQGKPGLSNSFGAALWGVDFNLYCASVGFKRVHMHMGTNYRYASWQPIATDLASLGTKPPYYGNIVVASFLGDTTAFPVSIAHIPFTNTTTESAYAAYLVPGGQLARIMVLNMNGYNTTIDGTGLGLAPNAPARVSRTYTFDVGGVLDEGDKVGVRRLFANGSDAISGITWDGWSYNYELDEGRPVRLANVTVGESVVVSGGAVVVSIPDSSAAVLDFVAAPATVPSAAARTRGMLRLVRPGGRRW